MDYDSYKNDLANLLTVSVSDTSFLDILPEIIAYAENRCYRELDLLDTNVVDSGQSLSANNRNFTIPSAYWVVEQLNVISPAGSSADAGTRNQLLPVARYWLDLVYPNPDSTGVPKYFAMVDQFNIVVAPTPDESYRMEIIGTQQPEPLSESNTETFLTEYLSDLFLAASMVYGSGWQRNFGSQADDPKMAASWEGQTQTLMASAKSVEWRKKQMASSWSSLQTPPEAKPERN